MFFYSKRDINGQNKTDNFKCIWSVAKAWGNIEVSKNIVKFIVFENDITLKAFGLKFCDKIKSVKIDGTNIDYSFIDGTLYFDEKTIKNSMEIEI